MFTAVHWNVGMRSDMHCVALGSCFVGAIHPFIFDPIAYVAPPETQPVVDVVVFVPVFVFVVVCVVVMSVLVVVPPPVVVVPVPVVVVLVV